MRLWVENDPRNKELFIGYALIGAGYLITAALWAWYAWERPGLRCSLNTNYYKDIPSSSSAGVCRTPSQKHA